MPEIAILLATKNGGRFLSAQLESFLWQSLVPTCLFVGDDGSSDATREILRRFADRSLFPMSLRDGPRLGPAQNFLRLIRDCPPWVSFAALSDQDDLWLPDHLSRGVDALRTAQGPALYCGRSVITDTALTPLRLFPDRGHHIGFAHALVEGLAGGNTMVLNRAALDLAADLFSTRLTTHDWWLYQLITGVGGTVIYDRTPSVLYRQHRHNLVGAPVWYGPGLWRLRQMRRGGLRKWNAPQIEMLHSIRHKLKPENQRLLDRFRTAREHRLPFAALGLNKAGIRRSGFEGRLAMIGSALSGQI